MQNSRDWVPIQMHNVYRDHLAPAKALPVASYHRHLTKLRTKAEISYRFFFFHKIAPR